MKNVPEDIEKYPCRNTSLENLPDERWAEIPGLEDSYHVSDYGRIKSLAREIHYTNGKVIHKKEKILMAGISPANNYYVEDFTYQLHISLNFNNKIYRYSVARLVHYCFNDKTFDFNNHSLFILQKDGNGLNCYYNNLIAVSAESKQKRIYDKERNITSFSWLDMKAIVQKDIERRYKMVTQYDKNGEIIRTFKSIKEASKATGIYANNISAVTNGYWVTAGGYIWRKGKGKKKIDVSKCYKAGSERYKEKRGKKIVQLTKQGRFIKKYLSISDAAKETNIPYSNISRAVKGDLHTAGKFKWELQNK
jgi:hypothetical protein